MDPRARILVVNAGSSSLKAAVLEAGVRRASVAIEEIGAAGGAPDHPAALGAALERFEAQGLAPGSFAAAGHRVVHGGAGFAAPVRIDPETLARMARCDGFAPLHNPHNLAAIRALASLRPALPQVACFDTAFHLTNPPVATAYALPESIRAAGVRRYGFHGLSYQSLVARLPEISGAPLPARLLAFHLGNGASLCAIREGRSVATTMGFTPLDGLTMGTRCGALDPGAVFHLLREGWSPAALERTLQRDSGLRGLSGGISDMRALLAGEDAAARFAVEHFCYWAARHAGSMIAAMEGVDALAFTGGIGERAAPVRAAILDRLRWIGLCFDPAANDSAGPALHAAGSRAAIWIVPADEEAQIARLTLHTLKEEARA